MQFFIVDCFAQAQYQGNQLGVFIADRDLPTSLMQKIARELNFSESAFILSGLRENGGYDVRIFTPFVEVPFAGHPALGAAYVLDKLYGCGNTAIKLNLPCGQIPLYKKNSSFYMEQNQPEFGAIVPVEAAATALSLPLCAVRSDLPVQCVSTGLDAVIMPLTSTEALAECRVNYESMTAFRNNWIKCNLLAFVEDKGEIHVRVFMDDPGYLEDPATGSANGDLAAYLLKYNYFRQSSVEYITRQGTKMGRPSVLYIEASLQNNKYSIKVGGEVKITAQGDWL